MKSKGIILFITIFLISCNVENNGNSYKKITEREKEKSQLDSLKLEAANSFHDFKLALQMKDNDSTLTNFFVKEEFRAPNNQSFEHLWIRDVFFDGDELKGIVDNIPKLISEVKHNDTLVIDENKISDWMYYKGKKVIGGYSIKFERNKLNDIQKKEFDERYNADF